MTRTTEIVDNLVYHIQCKFHVSAAMSGTHRSVCLEHVCNDDEEPCRAPGITEMIRTNCCTSNKLTAIQYIERLACLHGAEVRSANEDDHVLFYNVLFNDVVSW